MDSKERRRLLWGKLRSLIRNNGSVITSAPDHSPIRFEIMPGSDLPELLAEMGFSLRPAGTTERLMPMTEMVTSHGRSQSEKVAVNHIGQVVMQIFEFDL